MWLGGSFQFGTFWTMNRLFSVRFSYHHLNTSPLHKWTQIYHSNNRLVWYSDGYCNWLVRYLSPRDLSNFWMVCYLSHDHIGRLNGPLFRCLFNIGLLSGIWIANYKLFAIWMVRLFKCVVFRSPLYWNSRQTNFLDGDWLFWKIQNLWCFLKI